MYSGKQEFYIKTGILFISKYAHGSRYTKKKYIHYKEVSTLNIRKKVNAYIPAQVDSQESIRKTSDMLSLHSS